MKDRDRVMSTKTEYSDAMVDLETLGLEPGFSVISIGAVAFNRHEDTPGHTFYVEIHRGSCTEAGLREDPDTVAWWGKQDPEAQKVLNGTVPLDEALSRFSVWYRSVGCPAIWGNGPSFDMAMLQACYSALGRSYPWKFWNERCFRTIRDVLEHAGIRGVGQIVRDGVYHNALDDAMAQAKYTQKILRAMR